MLRISTLLTTLQWIPVASRIKIKAFNKAYRMLQELAPADLFNLTSHTSLYSQLLRWVLQSSNQILSTYSETNPTLI